jgi:hypothetical protein
VRRQDVRQAERWWLDAPVGDRIDVRLNSSRPASVRELANFIRPASELLQGQGRPATTSISIGIGAGTGISTIHVPTCMNHGFFELAFLPLFNAFRFLLIFLNRVPGEDSLVTVSKANVHEGKKRTKSEAPPSTLSQPPVGLPDPPGQPRQQTH